MKIFFGLLGAGLISLGAGCASNSVAVAPVGPNPTGHKSVGSTGGLQVFSSVVKRYDDQNVAGDGVPGWYQHTDYSVFDTRGKLVKYVGNAAGHYAEGPVQIALPAGKYVVRARAKDYLWVEVPVTIQRGRTTRVHLDDNWELPADAPKGELVTMPDGNPVGWRAGSSREFGIN